MTDGGPLRHSLDGQELESRIADTAIPAGGYVLKLISTGHVDLAGADENAYGISVKSTREWVGDGLGGGSWTATASVPALIQREGEALVQLPPGHGTIVIGNPMKTYGGGRIKVMSFTSTPTLAELKSLVGIANEAKAESAGGVLKVILNILRL